MPVGLDGTSGTPAEILRLTMGTRFSGLETAVAADGRVLVVAWTDFGSARYAVIALDASGHLTVADGPTDVMVSGMVQRVAATAFGTDFALALDVAGGSSVQRVLRTSLASTDDVNVALVGSSLPASLGLASDGSHLVTNDGGNTLHFFDASGADVGTATVPARLVSRPLASDVGRVLVAFGDGAGVSLAYAKSDGTVTTPEPGPPGVVNDDVSVFDAGSRVVLTEIDPGGATGWLLGSDLTTLVRSAVRLDSGRGMPSRVSAVGGGFAVGVAAAFPAAGASLHILQACGS